MGVSRVLHRDIFWLGRQWAVTGYGIQAVSQKHKMKFDIDVSQIWKEDLDVRLRDEAWFDACLKVADGVRAHAERTASTRRYVTSDATLPGRHDRVQGGPPGFHNSFELRT